MSRRRVIIGAGAHGKVVLDILREQGEEVLGWLDDNAALWGKKHCGLEVLGGMDNAPPDLAAIVAIGHNEVRMKLAAKAESKGLTLINAIHPSAVISRTAMLGRGVCVCAGAVVGADARLGDNVLVNTGSTVDHDCVLEEGACLAPGVTTAGAVRIGRGAYVSTGTVLVAGVSIGEQAVVGAGAVVTKHIPAGVLALGMPARVVKKIDETFDWKRLVSGIDPLQSPKRQEAK